jgi:serine/threonine-protein kinase
MGMTDTLIVRLSEGGGVIVRPLSSVRRFAREDEDAQQAGTILGTDAVLDGSIQRWGDKLRVNVRLVHVDTGESIWSGTYDEMYTDIFRVQDAIAAKVAEALRSRLGQNKRQQTRNMEAYRLYLQGRFFMLKSTPVDIRKGIEFYEQAIQSDPEYALAFAGMADAYRMLPITSDVASAAAFPKAKAAALKAVELDDGLADAHVVLGYVASWYEWDWSTAEVEMRRAVALNPSNPDGHRGLSILLTVLGRHEEAIAEMRSARELDPLSLLTSALEAQALFYAGREREAAVRLEKTFEIDGNYWIARVMLARIYLKQNRWDDALEELRGARKYSAGNSETISLTIYALARSGQLSEARSMLSELHGMSSGEYTPSYNIAMAYNGLGDKDAALLWLDKAANDRDVRLILLKVEPKWNDLRELPKFAELIKRMNFE